MNPKKAHLKYKKIWQFPQATHDFIQPMIKGRSLHVCCGNSLLCDVRVDIEKQEIFQLQNYGLFVLVLRLVLMS